MIAIMKTTNRTEISQRVNDVRASWSPSQRNHRALAGQRDCEEIARLIGLTVREPELWRETHERQHSQAG